MNQKLMLSETQGIALKSGFMTVFGNAPERYFSAPGRTEIGGNHTDHQRGHVLAAAVNLDTNAAVRVTGTNYIRVQSAG
jgi:galactokinase